MQALKMGNLALAFFLEIAALAAYAYWGFTVGPNLALKLLLGIGVPLLAIIVWAIFGAPNSPRHLTGIPYQILALLVFGPVVLALVYAGRPTLAIVYLVLQIINRVLIYVWKQ